MLQIFKRIEAVRGAAVHPNPSVPRHQLRLPYSARQKSRFRAELEDGAEAAIILPRGTVLRDGDVLEASDGTLVGVRAAAEPVSIAAASNPLLAMRAAYHLGNRHVALQISSGRLVYLHDHVLDAMLERLGLVVTFDQLPFDPEPGAYDGSHSHAHEHAHAHEHVHGPRSHDPRDGARSSLDFEAGNRPELPTLLELPRPAR